MTPVLFHYFDLFTYTQKGRKKISRLEFGSLTKFHSLLAAPIILDLVLLAKLRTRIQLKAEGEVCFFLVLMGPDPPSSCFWIYLSNGMITMIQRMFNFCRGSSVPSTQLPPSSIPFNSPSHVWDFSDSEAAPASSWFTLPNRSILVFFFFFFFFCVCLCCKRL